MKLHTGLSLIILAALLSLIGFWVTVIPAERVVRADVPAGGDGGDAGSTGPGAGVGDAPGDGDNACSAGGEAETPLLSVWDGEGYVLENEILRGHPSSYHQNYQVAKVNYESGAYTNELYRLVQKPAARDGLYHFRIQILSPEEDFIDQLTLTEVMHPTDSMALVRSDLSRFLVLKRWSPAEELTPTQCLSQDGSSCLEEYRAGRLARWPGESVILSFPKPSSVRSPKFFAQALCGAWDSPDPEIAEYPLLSQVYYGIVGPILGPSAPQAWKVIHLAHRTSDGWQEIALLHPRKIQPSREIVDALPLVVQAEESGDIVLKVDWSRGRHVLQSLVLLPDTEDAPFIPHELPLVRVYHHRSQQDVTSLAAVKDFSYLHLRTGDTVDVEFLTDAEDRSGGMVSSFVLSAKGFYTNLFLTSP